MGTILILDDDARARGAMGATLREAGHETVEVGLGVDALRALRIDDVGRADDPQAPERDGSEAPIPAAPILAVVDVVLPDMHGFEVVRRIRQDERLRDMPILMVSDLDDPTSRRLAIRLGADDYVAKPASPEDLLLRVNRLTRRLFVERTLLTRIGEVEASLLERQRQAALVVHDVHNPLAAILACIQEIDAAVAVVGGETREALADAADAAHRIVRIVDQLVTVASHEREELKMQPSRVVVADAVRAILRESRRRLGERQVEIEVHGGDEAVLVDRDVLGRILDNLVANALRHCPRGGLLRVEWRTDRDRVRVSVGNTGKPIPAEARARMFDEHWSASGSTGLGLYFCRVAIAAHGGSVVLEDGGDLPTIFTFDLAKVP